MSNSTPTHSPKLTSERKKEKKEQRRESDLLSALREIETVRDRGHGVDVRARRSTRSNSNEGQRAAAATEGGWVSATEKNLRVEICGFNFQFSDSKHALLF